jgi:outer membrane immunogenic protein
MRNSAIGIAAITALLATPALAAPPPPVPAVTPWTGFYVGVNGGFGWSAFDSNVTAVNVERHPVGEGGSFVVEGTATAGSIFDPIGGFGGGQIGYNWQLAPQWVAGIEADIQGGGIHDSATASALNPVPGDTNDVPPGSVNAYAKSNLVWFGTVRARIGYLLDNLALIYATGGFAFGGVKDTLSVTEISEGTLLSGTVNSNRTATGFVVGAGVERYFTPSWSLKAEYQYIDLGSTTLATGAAPSDCCDAPSGSANISHKYHTFRVGLNYKWY